MLKTDDDCYVRMPKILAALQSPPESAPAAGLPPPHMLTGGGAAAASGAGPQLTAVRQGLQEWMARDGGHPLHTDGLNVYNATGLVKSASAGGTAGGLAAARRTKVAPPVTGLHVSRGSLLLPSASSMLGAPQLQQDTLSTCVPCFCAACRP